MNDKFCRMRNCLLCLIFFFIIGIGNAQDLRLRKGTIIDSIVVPNSNNETYALYLPKAFSMDKNWPVVFVFYPMMEGKKPMNQFYQAAEKYKYIIVASNEINNGPYKDNFKKATDLITTFISKFPVDMQRMYLAGFSEGAIIAMDIASLSVDFKGVISVGSGFTSSALISSANSITYVGIAGDEDFNYNEVKRTIDVLKKRRYNAEFFPFQGEYIWTPSLQIEKALRLFILKAMNKGYMSMDEKLIHEFYLTDYNYNKRILDEEKYNWAYNDLKNLQKNYRFHVDSDSLKVKLKLLAKNSKYKIQKNNALEVDFLESYFLSQYLTFLSSDIEVADMMQIGMWEKEMDSLEILAKKNNSEGEKMEKRLKNALLVYIKELTENYHEKDDLDHLLYANALITIIQPNNYSPYLKVLKYTVEKSEYGMALFFLEELLKNGFKDSQKLNDLEGIASLRISPEYNDLLKKYGLKYLY